MTAHFALREIYKMLNIFLNYFNSQWWSHLICIWKPKFGHTKNLDFGGKFLLFCGCRYHASGNRMYGRAVCQVNGVKWHQCVYCAKEFKKPSDVVRHVRIHTHEKPFKCGHCFRSFAVKSTLTAHAKTHSGVKEYKCQVCEKLFSTQGSLKVHLRLHTGQYCHYNVGCILDLQSTLLMLQFVHVWHNFAFNSMLRWWLSFTMFTAWCPACRCGVCCSRCVRLTLVDWVRMAEYIIKLFSLPSYF